MKYEWKINHPQMPPEVTDDERRARAIYGMHMTVSDTDWIRSNVSLDRREVGEWEPAIPSIASQTLQDDRPPKGGRRGRRFMGTEERREVSARMRKYWATRRASA